MEFCNKNIHIKKIYYGVHFSYILVLGFLDGSWDIRYFEQDDTMTCTI
jgi:hypothetical protein